MDRRNKTDSRGAWGSDAAASSSPQPRQGVPTRREPRLDELLDDPIMALLWHGDRLEPRAARAAVLGLREVVRRGREPERLSA